MHPCIHSQVYYNDLQKVFSNPDCSSAFYGVNMTAAQPTITVNNTGLDKHGAPRAYLGYATETKPPAGELSLVLEGVPHKASYRICAVGEPTFYGKYHQYSVVTDDTGFSLYVMARNITDFFVRYDAEVHQVLSKLGYTGIWAPKKNKQDSSCPMYAPWPSVLGQAF